MRTLSLSDFLPYRLNVAAAAVSEGLATIYSEQFGIGIPEWRVLATLGETRTMTAKAIGEHAHMNKVKVSRAVTALEERGLVQRTTNEKDLREAFLTLTAAGADIHAEIAPLALDYVAVLLEGLTRQERDDLLRLLQKVQARAAAMAAIARAPPPASR